MSIVSFREKLKPKYSKLVEYSFVDWVEKGSKRISCLNEEQALTSLNFNFTIFMFVSTRDCFEVSKQARIEVPLTLLVIDILKLFWLRIVVQVVKQWICVWVFKASKERLYKRHWWLLLNAWTIIYLFENETCQEI